VVKALLDCGEARFDHRLKFEVGEDIWQVLFDAFADEFTDKVGNYVGELVREGVEKDWPYIFTDLEFEPMIEARFAAIKQGFDYIRGRNPKR